MPFLTNNSMSSSLNLSLKTIGKCVDCDAKLQAQDYRFSCTDCQRQYTFEESGVWDFRQTNARQRLPAIFEENEFKRWITIFREQESKNWIIYKNRVFRFIAQAGHRILARRINRKSTANTVVLEVGAGTGSLLEYVPANNFVAVDTSMESLQVLKSRWPGVTCICASASALPFKSGSFDQVVSLHTLEHLYFLAEAMQELGRVAQPDGTMHYAIPTEGGLAFFLGRKLITGPHLRKKYDLDVQYVMDREHINDAARVLKFLHMHFNNVECRYWPLSFVKIMSLNAMIFGECSSPVKDRWRHD